MDTKEKIIKYLLDKFWGTTSGSMILLVTTHGYLFNKLKMNLHFTLFKAIKKRKLTGQTFNSVRKTLIKQTKQKSTLKKLIKVKAEINY